MKFNSDIIRFILGRFISSIGSQLVLFAVPLIIYHNTGSVSKSGAAFAIEWLIGISALPIGGTMADKWGGKVVYMLADLVRCLVCIVAYLFLMNMPSQTFIILTVMAGIMSFFTNQAYVSLESVLPRYFSVDEIPKVQAVLQGIDQVSQIIGPIFAAFFVISIDIHLFLLFTSVAFFISFINFFTSGKSLSEDAFLNKKTPLVEHFKIGFHVISEKKSLFLYIGYAVFINLVYCTLLAVGAALTTGVFAKSNSYYGILNSIAGGVTVAALAIVPLLTKKISIFNIGLYAFIGVIIGGLVVSFASSFSIFALGFGLVIAADAFTSIYVRTERARIIPREHFGKTLGIMIPLIGLSYPLSGAIVAFASEKIGIQNLILVLTIISLIGNFGILFMLRLSENQKNMIEKNEGGVC